VVRPQTSKCPTGYVTLKLWKRLLTNQSQRPLRLFILLFSVDPALRGTRRPENNNKQALRAFAVKKYRVAIDFFLCALCGFAVTKNEI
jgi:hypothetical protein